MVTSFQRYFVNDSDMSRENAINCNEMVQWKTVLAILTEVYNAISLLCLFELSSQQRYFHEEKSLWLLKKFGKVNLLGYQLT